MDLFYKICILYEGRIHERINEYFKDLVSKLGNEKVAGLKFYNTLKKIGEDDISEQIWLIDKKDRIFNEFLKNDLLIKQYTNGSRIIININEDNSLNNLVDKNFIEIGNEKINYENIEYSGIKINISNKNLEKFGIEKILNESINNIQKKIKK